MIAAIPVFAATETFVTVDLSFQGDCDETGTAGFYVGGLLHHEEPVSWNASRPLDLLIGGEINTDGPEITLRLTSPERGVVLEIPVPQLEDDPETYTLSAVVAALSSRTSRR